MGLANQVCPLPKGGPRAWHALHCTAVRGSCNFHNPGVPNASGLCCILMTFITVWHAPNLTASIFTSEVKEAFKGVSALRVCTAVLHFS